MLLRQIDRRMTGESESDYAAQLSNLRFTNDLRGDLVKDQHTADLLTEIRTD